MTENGQGMPRAEVPSLEGWVSFDELADRLGVSKQAVHKMLETGRITTARKVGRKAIYILTLAEADALCEARGVVKTTLAEEPVSLPAIFTGPSLPEPEPVPEPTKPVLVDVL